MSIELLSKALAFYDMKDVFEIIPESTIQHLNIRLDILFGQQAYDKKARNKLADNPLDNELITSVASVSKAVDEAK